VRWRQGALSLVVLCGALAGCTPVPSQVRPPGAASQRPASPSPSPVVEAPPPAVVPPPVVPLTPAATGFSGQDAVSCAGRPTAERVIALVRSHGMLAAGTAVTVPIGPLCAGTWQYTVLSVTGREALQVVSRGTPDALQLVAAGTDVCSDDVRAQAPPGIVSVAHCG